MRRPSQEALDLTRWPGVDPQALAPDVRRRYRQRARAVELYAKGRSIEHIQATTGLDRRTLYRAIERALKAHPDGRPWGFRALIPALRVKAYARRAPPVQRGRGLSGAFEQLLDRHESLERLVRQLIQTRSVWMVQRGSQTYLRGLNPAHQRFTAACRALGLTARDYPLNHQEEGRRSLARALRVRIAADFDQAARSAGAPRVKPAAALAFAPERPVTAPFHTVEFDAHKLDVRLKLLQRSGRGPPGRSTACPRR
jgi:hypothetical protein